MGVIESLKAMQWVLILTVLALYACSIVFTSVVGGGLISAAPGEGQKETLKNFGTVTDSIFSLFKLMNGDTSVVEPITDSPAGQLIFVTFMIISNWAILAILTSVVSDNMISTSQKQIEDDAAAEGEKDRQKRLQRLTTLFQEVDREGTGYIGKQQWCAILEDKGLHYELRDASGLTDDALNDCFVHLARFETDGVHDGGAMLPYDGLLKILKVDGLAADKAAILHLTLQLGALENRILKKLKRHDETWM